MCETFVAAPSSEPGTGPRPFVYVSAEDIYRPLISARYIETKRAAEQGIEEMVLAHPEGYRGVYIRPSTCLLIILAYTHS